VKRKRAILYFYLFLYPPIIPAILIIIEDIPVRGYILDDYNR